MENNNTFLNKFKRGLKASAIWAFGLRTPHLIRFDRAEVELICPELPPLAVQLVRPELVALLTEASILTVAGKFSLNINLLLDIPERYQFSTDLFLRQPQLLMGVIESQLIPPPQYPVKGALWLKIDATELHDPQLGTPQINDLTAQMVAEWPWFKILDLFSVLTGDGKPSPDRPEIEAIDLQLATYASLDTSEAVIDDAAVIILDLFEFLTTGRVLGKNYELEPLLKKARSKEAADSDICRHGLVRSTCAECNPPEPIVQMRSRSCSDTDRRTGSLRPPVVNVFDLLLPYLQPPIESIRDWSIIFPPGKKLYDFQVSGSHFLVTTDSVLLADEMGLGKSIQAIFALRILFRRGRKPMTALILCPKSVLIDWERKLKEWAPELRVTTIEGNHRLRLNLWRTPSHVFLAGYDSAVSDIAQVNTRKYDVIVLDEIQAIKNPSTKRTKTIRTIQAERRWGLSATPLENKAEDLISIFAYLKPGYLRYEDAQNRTRLKNRIKPYFLRRRVKDVGSDINLDEPIFSQVWLQLTPEQQKRYDHVLEKARKNLRPFTPRPGLDKNEFETKRAVLAEITELKKICNFDPVTGQSCKADYLKERLEDICDINEKALIFSQYPNISLKPLADKLSRFKPDLFDGSLSNSQRDQKIGEFQNTDNTNILLMSVKAGGVGITLTRANHVFFLDQWWNPAVQKQAYARAHRIGQDKTVRVTNFCVENTIEERILRILERKQQLFDEIIDDESTKVYEKITVEELFEILDMVQFDVILRTAGRAVGRTIQAISEIAEIGDYQKARKLVQHLPATILKNVSREKAEKVKQYLAEISGALVEIRPNYID